MKLTFVTTITKVFSGKFSTIFLDDGIICVVKKQEINNIINHIDHLKNGLTINKLPCWNLDPLNHSIFIEIKFDTSTT